MLSLNALIGDARSAIDSLASYADEAATELAEANGRISILESELESARFEISQLEKLVEQGPEEPRQ